MASLFGNILSGKAGEVLTAEELVETHTDDVEISEDPELVQADEPAVGPLGVKPVKPEASPTEADRMNLAAKRK